MPNLIVLSGLRRGLVTPARRRTVLGRGAEVDLRLPDFLVSGRHAEVAAEGAGWVLRDLGSTNGSFRNGRRLQGEEPLVLGDIVQVGATELLFTDSDQAPRAEEGLARATLLADREEEAAYAVRMVTEPGAEDLLLATVERGLAPDVALTVAQAVQGAFGRAWDLDDLLHRVAERFGRAAGGRGVVLSLAREPGGPAEVVYRGVLAGDTLFPRDELDFAVREDLLERALGEQGAVIARAGPDTGSTSELALQEEAADRGDSLALCLALPTAAGAIGAVYVHDARPALTQEDLGLLSLLARLAGIHLRDHLLVAALRERNAELEAARGALAAANDELRERVAARTAQLAETERRQRLLARVVESTPEAVVSVTLEGVVTSWNPAAEALYGYAAAEVLGQVLPTVPDERSGELEGILRAVSAGRTLAHRTTRVTRDDREVQVAATFAPVIDPSGRVEGLVEVARDLAEQLALEERMRWRERLDSAARLARGLAHELGNPLANLRSGVDYLLSRPRPEPVVQRTLAVLREELLRLQRLTQRALDLSTWETPRMAPVPLRALLRDAAAAAEARARDAAIELAVAAGEAEPDLARGDRDQLIQVALNLVANALDATPRGGRIELSLVSAGERVGFAVADTGRGIPSEHLARVWEPFFSRRPQGAGAGLGLGLAIVRRIVDAHEGELALESVLGEGTTFSVLVPRAEEAP